MSARAAVSERLLMAGNEAVAAGAHEAGVGVATGYPGTPSTEILEALARYPGGDVRWSANEKVALDVAAGASFGGARAIVTMKHVGLNVAADTFMTLAYTGVGAGLVIVTADDPGMHSSQNEQDNRVYARFAGIPMLEPGDSQEARDYTLLAFEISEEFDTPVLLRLTTRISHTRGLVAVTGSPAPSGPTWPVAPARAPAGFRRDRGKYVMLPANARARHPVLLARLERLAAYAERSPLTRTTESGSDVVVVTSGVSSAYVAGALPEISLVRLGFTYPVPIGRIREFAAGRPVLVVEESEPFLQDALRAAGIPARGKEFFPQAGELSPEVVREGFVLAGLLPAASPSSSSTAKPVTAPPAAPARPPVMCPGCPHVVPFLALRDAGAVVAGDIGCYTLAALPPLEAMDTCVAMGSSIGMAVGLAASRATAGASEASGTSEASGASEASGTAWPVAAAIGDSTFLHSGIPALIDAVYSGADITVLILNNGTTAMTGGQHHPATGMTLRGQPAPAVDLAALCRAAGAEHVEVTDPYDVGAVHAAIRRAIAFPGPAVVITNRPCVEAPLKVRDQPFAVVPDACISCQLCMNLGCPSITWDDSWHDGRRLVAIDTATCTGCTVCAQLCPAGAIIPLALGKAP